MARLHPSVSLLPPQIKVGYKAWTGRANLVPCDPYSFSLNPCVSISWSPSKEPPCISPYLRNSGQRGMWSFFHLLHLLALGQAGLVCGYSCSFRLLVHHTGLLGEFPTGQTMSTPNITFFLEGNIPSLVWGNNYPAKIPTT